MARSWRIVIALVMFGLVAGLVVGTSMAYLRSNPPTVDFASGHQAGQPVDLTLQTVGTIGFGAHPTWVSYLTKAPDGNWVHTTLWDLPAHTQINVTIVQYDTGSPLRNQFFGQVSGTQGATILLNGKSTSLIDSNAGNGVGHTFTVPSLGINVPLVGVNLERQQHLQRGAVHAGQHPQHHPVFLHDTRAGPVPVAVLPALRAGFSLRHRRPDADDRLHGRVLEGHRMTRTGRGTEWPT